MTQNILIQNWWISSRLIIDEAEKLWFTINIINPEKNLFVIENNSKKVYFKSIDCWANTSLWLKSANDKELTYLIGEREGIRVPKSIYLNRWDIITLKQVQEKLKLPVISKPIDGAHGDGVYLHISTEKQLSEAIDFSFWKETQRIVIQEEIQWEDHRVIVIWNKVVAGTKRIPPEIIGDNTSTIEELIVKENKNPDRIGKDHSNKMSPIKIDSELLNCIEEQWYTITSILPLWVTLRVRNNANLSSGWKAIDITDIIHPTTKKECIKLAHSLGLSICGVDIFSTDISKELDETHWAIIEVNATPWIRMHHFPSEGIPRNVAKEILEFMFQK